MLKCEMTLRREWFPLKLLQISRTLFYKTSGEGSKKISSSKKLKIKAKKYLMRILKHSIFYIVIK